LAKQQNITMPITEQVYRLLQSEVTPRQALDELMVRDIKPEYNY
jgi:glycerol-3-phosphate dehydrogenase (NAD(P)+)